MSRQRWLRVIRGLGRATSVGIVMLLRPAAILGLILLQPFVLGARAAGPQQVTITATELKFTPNTVTLTVGQPVQLTIVNQGAMDHDLKSALPIAEFTYQRAANDADEQQQNVKDGVLDVDFKAGDQAQVTFTPTTAGTYAFACDVPGHADAGMKGTFVVQAAPTLVAAARTRPALGPWLLLIGLLVLAGLGGTLALRRRS